MRGFAAIGLHRPKNHNNVAGCLRAAHCYGATLVAIAGDRLPNEMIYQGANTTKAHRHLPVLRGASLKEMVPYGAVPVAVDLLDGAVPLPDFRHPESAFYIFGPEDGTLGAEVTDWCAHKVFIPTSFCMNLASTVNVVLYDRMAKRLLRK